MALNVAEITSVLKQEIAGFEQKLAVSEVGTVIEVGDGIARIYGLRNAMAGELLEFENGTMGQVFNLEEESIGAVIFGNYLEIKEGDTVKSTGRLLEVPVGDAVIGRVVNPLGQPLDGGPAIKSSETRKMDIIAPGIAEGARPLLATKANLRVVTTDFSAILDRPAAIYQETRSFLGGTLLQDTDRVVEARAPWPQGDSPRVVTRRPPTPEEWTALRFAWRVCAHVKSNAVIFTAADRTLAIGAGQMSRVDAVKVAVLKAAPGSLAGSVAASIDGA